MAEIVVVGGGLAGLIASRRLALLGHSVELLEQRDHLGGSITRHSVAGIDLDAGPDSFLGRGGAVAALASEIGLGDQIVPLAPLGEWVQPVQGGPKPLPQGNYLGIPATPMAEDSLAILGAGAATRAQLDALIPSLFAKRSITIGELVRRRMGRETLEKLVAPVVRGLHSRHPDDLDIDLVAPGLRAALTMQGSLAAAVRSLGSGPEPVGAVFGIRGGMHRVIVELLADLERLDVTIRTGATVTAVEADGVRVGEERIPGRVVLAAPGLSGVQGVRVRTSTVTIALREPALDAAPRGTAVFVAEGAPGIEAIALQHLTAAWPWLRERSAGQHILRLNYIGDRPVAREVALRDAAAILGVPLAASAVTDIVAVTGHRPALEVYAADGIIRVGESVAGLGISAVIAQAETEAESLHGDISK